MISIKFLPIISTDHAFENGWSQKMETLSQKKMNLIDTFANSLILSLVLQKMYGDKKNMNLNCDIRV